MRTPTSHSSGSCPSFRGHFACTAAALDRLLRSVEARPIVGDLSLGAWTSYSAAKQLAAQLGVELPRPSGPGLRALRQGEGLSYADLISHGVDAESLGNRVVDAALRCARVLREATASVTPFIILPRYGLPLEDEDVLFLSFLERDRAHATLRLVSCDAVPPRLPDGWVVEWEDEPHPAAPAASTLLSLVPGAVAPGLRALRGPTDHVVSVPRQDGWLVIAPESRRAPREVSRLDWDRLALRAKDLDPAIAVFAQYHGNNLYVNSAAFCTRAWAEFADGGVALALRYMQRVEDCAEGLDARALAQAQKQGMRIAQLCFADAAREPAPPAAVAAPLRSFLLQARGWGQVQTGAAAEARTLFAQAQELVRETRPEPRQVLYLLNIKALAELRCGDADEALHLEQRIERELATLDEPDWQLAYINAINQARLYKHRRDWARSEAYYGRAFATTWGLRSESDAVYTNLCTASLAEAAGRHDAALLAWIRAALHWVASARPEALTWRIAQALGPGAPSGEASYLDCARIVGEVSAALLLRLDGAAQRAGKGPGRASGRAMRFARFDDLRGPPEMHAAIGATGWSVLAAATEVDPVRRGDAHAQLQAWLCAWIERTGAAAAGDTYLVDARCGREIAGTFSELIETCVRRGVPAASFGGESITFDAHTLGVLEHSTTMRIGAGVERIDQGGVQTVRFKRYRPPRALTPGEARFVRDLEHGGAALPQGDPLARSLEEDRVIERILEQQACVAAGIRLPSAAS